MSYTLLLALVEFKTLVMREQLDAAWALLPSIPQARGARAWVSYGGWGAISGVSEAMHQRQSLTLARSTPPLRHRTSSTLSHASSRQRAS